MIFYNSNMVTTAYINTFGEYTFRVDKVPSNPSRFSMHIIRGKYRLSMSDYVTFVAYKYGDTIISFKKHKFMTELFECVRHVYYTKSVQYLDALITPDMFKEFDVILDFIKSMNNTVEHNIDCRTEYVDNHLYVCVDNIRVKMVTYPELTDGDLVMRIYRDDNKEHLLTDVLTYIVHYQRTIGNIRPIVRVKKAQLN